MSALYSSTAFGVGGSWLAEYTLASIGAGVVIFDATGVATQWNDAAPCVLGVEESGLAGRALHQLGLTWIGGSRIGHGDDPVRRVLTLGENQTGLLVESVNGRTVTLNLLPVYGADQTPRAVLASIVEAAGAVFVPPSDETSSTRTPFEHALFHGAVTANLVVGRSGEVIDWNGEALEMFQRCDLEMIGCGLSSVCDIDVAWVWDQLRRVDHGVVDGTTWAVLPHGDEVMVYGRFTMIDWPGEGSVLLIQLLDPSAFRIASATVRHDVDRVSRYDGVELFEQVMVPLLTITSGGLIVDANSSAADLLGLRRYDISGQALMSFVEGLDPDRFRLRLTIARISGRPVAIGEYRVRVDGDATRRVAMFASSQAAESPADTLIVQLVPLDDDLGPSMRSGDPATGEISSPATVHERSRRTVHDDAG